MVYQFRTHIPGAVFQQPAKASSDLLPRTATRKPLEIQAAFLATNRAGLLQHEFHAAILGATFV